MKKYITGLLLLAFAISSFAEEHTFFCISNIKVTTNKDGDIFKETKQDKIKVTLNGQSATFTYSSTGNAVDYQVDRFEVEDGSYFFVEGRLRSNGLFSMDHDYKRPDFPLVHYYQLGSFGYMTQYSCSKF